MASSELSAARARVRTRQEHEAQCRRAHDLGRGARVVGIPLDLNPYRRGDRRAAWARGWHEADREMADPPSRQPLELSGEGRAALADIRKILER